MEQLLSIMARLTPQLICCCKDAKNYKASQEEKPCFSWGISPFFCFLVKNLKLFPKMKKVARYGQPSQITIY
ncbi:hypothetical protein POV26_11365 [Aequorivita todarodis]|uniref:hypothetical protein n=1 Tax=Aequorivita todarodis TaxID=2036821 RepID=UPI002350B503|nr:hypothetical protein [Aequorivita todarodis]MDC8001638.1 hypothetical protein [Aequorivita todarodis]